MKTIAVSAPETLRAASLARALHQVATENGLTLTYSARKGFQLLPRAPQQPLPHPTANDEEE